MPLSRARFRCADEVGGGAMSLSIAFFGSSLVSAYWNGAATYYRGVLQALAANGSPHHVLRARRLRPSASSRYSRPGLGQGRRLSGDGGRGRACARKGPERRPAGQGERGRRVRRAARSAYSGSQAAGRHRRVLGCRRAGHAGPDRRRSRRPVPRADPGLRHRVHLWRRTAGRCRLQDVRRPDLRTDL